MTIEYLQPGLWKDYELLDTGNGKRFERFGDFTVVRPEPNAIWKQSLDVSAWQKANAVFTNETWDGELAPEPWVVNWNGVSARLKLTNYRHVGIFPEHVTQWLWVQNWAQARIAQGKSARVLSLFGYTGMASIAAARVGAEVCHCDASPGTVRWASENAAICGVREQIRWIVDDARAFIAREQRRERQYDLILMDPPEFGRGPDGEIWRLGRDLAGLLEHCNAVLSEDGSVQLTWYATELYPYSIQRVFSEYRPQAQMSVMAIEETSSNKLLQTSFSLLG